MTNETSPSTAAVAKKSLSHFAIGKVLAALVGIATLLLLVRSLSRDHYGVYITLFAAFEILQLAASPGAYAVAFRYLPELRPAGGGVGLKALVQRLTAYRIATLMVCAAGLFIAAPAVAELAGGAYTTSVVRLFALLLCFEGTARFIDVEFESLLQQGRAQVSALLRNGAKLLGLLLVGGAGRHEVTLELWLSIEVATSALGAVVSSGLLLHYGAKRARESVAQTLHMPTMARLLRFSVPTYFSQVLFLLTGAEMVKLLVSRLLGAQVIAAFGFASALSATVQKYLPSYLLIGWVRPLFISARASGRSTADLVQLAGTVIKINVLMLAPITTALLIAGEPLLALISGGRMTDGLVYLYFFVFLLFIQSARTVIALLGFTMEVGSGSLVATLVSVLGIGLGLAGYSSLGIWALCGGLAASELIWGVVMAVYLRASGMSFRLPWLSLAKFAASIALTASTLHALGVADLARGGLAQLLLALAAAVMVCLLFCAVLRPFTGDERALINKLLPLKVFVW
ncbi:lipopolysaccharide biosynthesis protein [Roseateles sp. DC23W]|uniref:Lipopolysaccharide biosynthesis protein n=1 Tax=Pelomonas dachongensis TaxID=3299029 RepID=A0ABW7EV92_9BURK